MLLNEFIGGLKNKIKQDLEFGKTYAANVVDQQKTKADPVSSSATLDPKKVKIAIQNRLSAAALSADDLAIFQSLSKSKDAAINSAAINTLRKLPLSSQDQRMLQNYADSV